MTRRVREVRVEEEDFCSDHRMVWARLAVGGEMRAVRGEKKPRRKMWRFKSRTYDKQDGFARYEKKVEEKLSRWTKWMDSRTHGQERSLGKEAAQTLVDEVYEGWREAVVTSMEEAVGKQTLGGQEKRWWSVALARLNRERVQLIIECRKSQRQKAKKALREKKAEFRREVRRSKAREAENMCKEGEERSRGRDSAFFWKWVKRRMGRGRGDLPAVMKTDEGEEVDDKEGIKEVWATAFEKLGVPLQNKEFDGAFEAEVREEVEAMDVGEVGGGGSGWEEAEIGEEEVKAVLLRLVNGKAAGDDAVEVEMLKYGGEAMVDSMVRLYQLVWRLEVVPSAWTRGVISPIYKSGDRAVPTNYRGITLLSVVSKAFESILNVRMTRFVETRGQMSDEQGGFRAGRSCADLLFLLSETLAANRESDRPTYMCFLDVKKAYDTVWHDGLWKRLSEVGVRGRVWRLLKGWYERMESAVAIDGEKGRWFRIWQGVKQGSVWSPLLFALYIDGVVRELKSAGLGVSVHRVWVGILLYADDIVLMARSGVELRQMLAVVEAFSHKWRFRFSAVKSKVMVVNSMAPGPMEMRDFRLYGERMEVVRAFKSLGVSVESGGGWSVVCSALMGSAAKVSGMLVGIGCRANKLSVTVGKRLWDAMVAPVLNYGAEVWAAPVSSGEKIERVMRKSAKTMLGCVTSTATDFVLSEMGWWSLAAQRDQLRLRFLWRLDNMDAARVVRRMYVARRIAWSGRGASPRSSERSWCSETARILRVYGLESAWTSVGALCGVPCGVWRARVRKAIDRVEWESRRRGMASKISLDEYVHVKKSRGLAEYLALQEGGSAWRAAVAVFARLRCGMNSLDASELGAKPRGAPDYVPRDQRLCSVCSSGAVGDERHFLLHCPAVAAERSVFWSTVRAKMGASYRGDVAALLSSAGVVGGSERATVVFMLGAVPSEWAAALRRSALHACVRGVYSMWCARARCARVSC
jgi:hypothetical protein